MSRELQRRLERLERDDKAPSLVLMYQEGDASREEMLRERFGPAGPPPGVEVVWLTWADGTS